MGFLGIRGSKEAEGKFYKAVARPALLYESVYFAVKLRYENEASGWIGPAMSTLGEALRWAIFGKR